MERGVEGLALRRVRMDAALARTAGTGEAWAGQGLRGLGRVALWAAEGGRGVYSHVLAEVMTMCGRPESLAGLGGMGRGKLERLARVACIDARYMPNVCSFVAEEERLDFADAIMGHRGISMGQTEDAIMGQCARSRGVQGDKLRSEPPPSLESRSARVHPALAWYGEGGNASWTSVVVRERERLARRGGRGRWRCSNDMEWGACLILGGFGGLVTASGVYLYDRLCEWRAVVAEGGGGGREEEWKGVVGRMDVLCDTLVPLVLREGGEVWATEGLRALCEDVAVAVCGLGGRSSVGGGRMREDAERWAVDKGRRGWARAFAPHASENQDSRLMDVCSGEKDMKYQALMGDDPACASLIQLSKALGGHGEGPRLNSNDSERDDVIEGIERVGGSDVFAARVVCLMGLGEGERELRRACQQGGWPIEAAELAAQLNLARKEVSPW